MPDDDLRSSQRDDQYESLVDIQPMGSRPPICGVHGLGVNMKFYRPLADRLGLDQPVFGLWRLPDRRRTSVDNDPASAIARAYADEVEHRHPTGPITPAGVSVASVVAFELAHQLTDRGREVALLVLFDSVGPDKSAIGPSLSERMRVHRQRLVRDPVDYLEALARKTRARVKRRAEIAELGVRRALVLPLQDQLVRRSIIEGDVARRRAYQYRPYSGRVLVFKAGRDPYAQARADAKMGWGRIITGQLDVVVVPGSHLSMLAEPQVRELADHLQAAQADALQQSGHADR